MDRFLTNEEQKQLLRLAREALNAALRGEQLPAVDLEALSPNLRRPGASFVTLTRKGELRGCIGALEPQQALALDVRDHAIAAAQQDYRFEPVQAYELADICIEISALSLPKDLDYQTPRELTERLQPGVDGVTLMDGRRRATFLPQVWAKLPATDQFLSYLCQKMGSAPDTWRAKKLRVQTYQVEEFHEEGEPVDDEGCLDRSDIPE